MKATNTPVHLPTTTVMVDGWEIPSGIRLADPAFFKAKAMEIVLGMESFSTGKRVY